MDPTSFVAPAVGRLVTTAGGAAAFVPSPLPPDIDLSWPLVNTVGRAARAIGCWAGFTSALPISKLLSRLFSRREALLSARIDGFNVSFRELLLFEIGHAAPDHDELRQVANGAAALMQQVEQRLSLRLIRELHAKLLRGVRGERQAPGEFRGVQNWIGRPGTKITEAPYIPPPVPEMQGALDAFEKFLHAETHLPALIRLALVHYQFEAIHPFLDGNGRVGRLLITLLLQNEKLLDQPLLYLSAFFEQRRDEYYDRLLDVSRRGAWGAWIEFFLQAVHDQAEDAVQRAGALLELREQYRSRVTEGRHSALMLGIIDRLFQSPAVTITGIARDIGASYPAAKQNVEKLVAAKILEPLSDARNRAYMAREILALIE